MRLSEKILGNSSDAQSVVVPIVGVVTVHVWAVAVTDVVAGVAIVLVVLVFVIDVVWSTSQ